MAVVKRMSSKAKVGKIEKYLKQEVKTEEKLISGMNCDSDNFAKQCEMTSLLYNKNQDRRDRKYYHIVQSFSPKDNDKLSYAQVHEIGMKFAKENFKGFEVLVVTHTDKDHKHNHFIVNSVNLDNGKKYRADNKSLWQLRRTSNELCEQYGLINSIQPLDKRAKEKIQSGELRKALRGEEVWKMDLRAQIKECASISKNEIEFKSRMKENYNVLVTERTRKSKGKKSVIYEYQNLQFMKKPCGEHRLGTDYELYGKEYLSNEFNRRNEDKAREKDTRTDGESAGADQSRTNTRAIESTITNRKIDIISADIKQRERELKGEDSKCPEDRTGDVKCKESSKKLTRKKH